MRAGLRPLGAALALLPMLPTAARPDPLPPWFAAIEAAQPLDRPRLEKVLGIRLLCDAGDCEGGPVTRTGIRIGKVELRVRGGSVLLVLDGLGGRCLPVADLQARLSLDPPLNGCTDGVTCLYASTRRPWGRLSVGVPEDGNPRCARSLVFDARP